MKELSMKDIRIKCFECGRMYFLPIEILEVYEMIDITCKSCGATIDMKYHSLKEQMRSELMKIVEKSSYQFLDQPPIKEVVKKMEKESK